MKESEASKRIVHLLTDVSKSGIIFLELRHLSDRTKKMFKAETEILMVMSEALCMKCK